MSADGPSLLQDLRSSIRAITGVQKGCSRERLLAILPHMMDVKRLVLDPANQPQWAALGITRRHLWPADADEILSQAYVSLVPVVYGELCGEIEAHDLTWDDLRTSLNDKLGLADNQQADEAIASRLLEWERTWDAAESPREAIDQIAAAYPKHRNQLQAIDTWCKRVLRALPEPDAATMNPPPARSDTPHDTHTQHPSSNRHGHAKDTGAPAARPREDRSQQARGARRETAPPRAPSPPPSPMDAAPVTGPHRKVVRFKSPSVSSKGTSKATHDASNPTDVHSELEAAGLGYIIYTKDEWLASKRVAAPSTGPTTPHTTRTGQPHTTQGNRQHHQHHQQQQGAQRASDHAGYVSDGSGGSDSENDTSPPRKRVKPGRPSGNSMRGQARPDARTGPTHAAHGVPKGGPARGGGISRLLGRASGFRLGAATTAQEASVGGAHGVGSEGHYPSSEWPSDIREEAREVREIREGRKRDHRGGNGAGHISRKRAHTGAHQGGTGDKEDHMGGNAEQGQELDAHQGGADAEYSDGDREGVSEGEHVSDSEGGVSDDDRYEGVKLAGSDRDYSPDGEEDVRVGGEEPAEPQRFVWPRRTRSDWFAAETKRLYELYYSIPKQRGMSRLIYEEDRKHPDGPLLYPNRHQDSIGSKLKNDRIHGKRPPPAASAHPSHLDKVQKPLRVPHGGAHREDPQPHRAAPQHGPAGGARDGDADVDDARDERAQQRPGRRPQHAQHAQQQQDAEEPAFQWPPAHVEERQRREREQQQQQQAGPHADDGMPDAAAPGEERGADRGVKRRRPRTEWSAKEVARLYELLPQCVTEWDLAISRQIHLNDFRHPRGPVLYPHRDPESIKNKLKNDRKHGRGPWGRPAAPRAHTPNKADQPAARRPEPMQHIHGDTTHGGAARMPTAPSGRRHDALSDHEDPMNTDGHGQGDVAAGPSNGHVNGRNQLETDIHELGELNTMMDEGDVPHFVPARLFGAQHTGGVRSAAREAQDGAGAGAAGTREGTGVQEAAQAPASQGFWQRLFGWRRKTVNKQHPDEELLDAVNAGPESGGAHESEDESEGAGGSEGEDRGGEHGMPHNDREAGTHAGHPHEGPRGAGVQGQARVGSPLQPQKATSPHRVPPATFNTPPRVRIPTNDAPPPAPAAPRPPQDRRPRREWTDAETNALKRGFSLHGYQWKDIKWWDDRNGRLLTNRTAADLKDRWRNIQKKQK